MTFTTTRERRFPVQMFRAGFRDGIDLPDAEPAEVLGRAFSGGCKMGRAFCRVRRS